MGVAVVLLYMSLGDRLVLLVATGGRGILQALGPPLVLVAAWTVLRTDARAAGFVRQDAFWAHAGPYLALIAVLPFLGVALHPEYGIATAYGVMRAAVPLSLLTVGYWTRLQGEAEVRWVVLGVVMLIALNGVYSLVQFVFRISGGAGLPLVTDLLTWDRQIQALYSERYVIIGRSSGFFINANQLGVWSVLGFWWSMVFVRGRWRILFAGAAFTSLITSNSRGAMAALLVTVTASVLLAGVNRLVRGRYSAGLVAGALTIAALAAVAAITLPQWIELVPGIDRIRTGLMILSGRVEADYSFAQRARVWGISWDFWKAHPLGTFGPPQVLLKHPVDNGLVEALLQGGLPLLLGYILLLGGGSSAILTGTPTGMFVGLASLGLLVNSISALPLSYTASAPYWLALGMLYAEHLPPGFPESGAPQAAFHGGEERDV